MKLILDLLETTGTIRGEKILKKVVEILKYSEAKTKLSDIDQAPKQSQDQTEIAISKFEKIQKLEENAGDLIL